MNKQFDRLIGLLSPHICKECGSLGRTLCNRCIINTLAINYPICLSCHGLCKKYNLCANCRLKLPFDDLIAISPRRGPMKLLVGDYKYDSQLATADVLARMFSYKMTGLYTNFTIIPIPTIDKHVRRRGFDHMKQIANAWSKYDNRPVNTKILLRTDNIAQHSRTMRNRSEVTKSLSLLPCPMPERIIILDDIWTTGSTLIAAANILKNAGAKHLVGVVVLYQPH